MDATIAPPRVFNFSPGPAVLPLPVLQQIQQDLLALPGAGASILEISHRSKTFLKIMEDTQAGLRRLLKIPSNYQILFLQGGSRLQFSMIPMNLLRGRETCADYIVAGSWGKYALAEAQREGQAHVAWDGKSCNYNRMPEQDELKLHPDAAYVHITSNETIQGIQIPHEPDTGNVPLVCDASSDFLCRPLEIERYGLLYACAQKNAGPSGVTVVILRDDLVQYSQDSLPGYLNFQNQVKENSLYNTPNTFGIYVVGLIVQWLENTIGGLEAMRQINEQKSRMLYEVIDNSQGFYEGHAERASRSLMNVTFRLQKPELEKNFFTEAEKQGLDSLPGHRSVGGVRASIYNAMPVAGVEALRQFMLDFQNKHA